MTDSSFPLATPIQGETPEKGVSFQNEGFVKASGTQFELNGKPYYCAGTNAFYAALKWIMSDSEVNVMFKEHANRGANVMRIFAHSNFDSVKDPMMPDFGVYNEDALRRLDLALASAAQNGIRVILTMSNYWPFLGGVQDWVDKGLGEGKDKELFFTDESLKAKYKDWLKKIITRTNTITGQKYIDDPTILAYVERPPYLCCFISYPMCADKIINALVISNICLFQGSRNLKSSRSCSLKASTCICVCVCHECLQ